MIANETAILLLEPTRSPSEPLSKEEYDIIFNDVKKAAKQAVKDGAVPPNLRETNSTQYTRGINFQTQNISIVSYCIISWFSLDIY